MIATGSLCTGYDGIGLGLAMAGLDMRQVFHAEIESGPAHVLKLEHPDVPNVGDIKTAPWGLAPHVDLLTSGDPCQSISIAGRRGGRDDPRFLWPFVRDAYREMRPQVMFFENVANMVAHDGGRTMAERFENLREDGYDVRWTVLGACTVGAPHHRHRWYALAVRVGAGRAGEAVRMGGVKAICGAPRSGGRPLLPTPITSDSSGPGNTDGRAMDLRTVACWVLPTPAARDGGARGTPSPAHAQRRVDDPKRSTSLEGATVLLSTPRATDGPHGGPNQRSGRGQYDALPGLVANAEMWGKYAPAIVLWEQITGTAAPQPTELGPSGGRRLSARLPEWMMGLRPGLLTERLSRNEALKAAGNGVVPHAAAAAWGVLTEAIRAGEWT